MYSAERQASLMDLDKLAKECGGDVDYEGIYEELSVVDVSSLTLPTVRQKGAVRALLSGIKANANTGDIHSQSELNNALYHAVHQPELWRDEEELRKLTHEQIRIEHEHKITVTPGLLRAKAQLEHETIVTSRATNAVAKVLAVNAAGQNMTVSDASTIAAENERIKVLEKQKHVEFEDHKRREELRKQLEIEEYREKSEAISKLATIEAEQRRKDNKELDGLYVQLVALQNDTNDSFLRAKRIERAEKEIARLEAKLDGLGPTAQEAGKAPAGQNNGGSNAPPEPGQSPPANVGQGNQPLPGQSLRNVQ